MLTLLRSLSAPLMSLILMMMASGLFNTFVSIRLEIEGFGPEGIGIVTSATYLGILIGSLGIDRWISKMGHIRSFVVFASILAAFALAQAFWINTYYWSALRFFGGICTAGVFIVIESWMLMQSAPNVRGIIISIYLAIFYGALSSGQLLVNIADPEGIFPFCIAAMLLTASILPISLHKITEPKLEETTRLNITQLYTISPLGFIGGVVSGMILAIVYSMMPIFAKNVGLSLSEIGTFMAIIIFGGFSLQWPLGYWADKTNRRKVLVAISLTTALLGLGIAFFSHHSTNILYALAWLFGGFSFSLYPISMAYACETIKEDQIVAATGGFVLSYSSGAIVGPLLVPFAMDFFGPVGVFYFLAMICTLLAVIGLKRPSATIINK